VPFNGAKMVYWRIVPDLANLQIAGQYSPDGVTWTEMPIRLSVTAFPASVDVEVKSHVGGTIGGAQTVFGYLLACP
jgi:hypothetical protein